MNRIQIFRNSEFGQVRIMLIDNEPWFVGMDIAQALGYKRPSDAIASHVHEGDKLKRCFTVSGQGRNLLVVNESGMYALIFGSKLESAIRFKNWVTSEVLPSIRKHGGYFSGQEEMSDQELFKGATDAAIVDLKIIARSLLNYQDVKGMAVFHNHPSGNPTPSREDLQMTNKIKNLTEIFDIELLDHFIVGKEKTLSFSQEVDSFQSENQNYQDEQEEMSLLKEDKSIYDMREATLKVGDKIKTSLSDETIVLDIDEDNAVLFDGRQFVEVYGLQSNEEKFFWNHGNYSDQYPKNKDSNSVDTLNSMIDKDYEGFVKALIMQEMGVDNPDLLEELYERYMRNDGVNLINDYFEELIYELEGEIPIINNRTIDTNEQTNKGDDLCNKIDDFINSYVELSNAMYEVDYDFAENYPMDKSFHDIDFISWAEATKTNLSKSEKRMEPGKDSKEIKKESTIAKLNKLKDKVARDGIGKAQGQAENKKNDREM